MTSQNEKRSNQRKYRRKGGGIYEQEVRLRSEEIGATYTQGSYIQLLSTP